jgi:DNA-binding response OmpR family regulator
MRKRILVADDDPDMRRLIRYVLERDGYEVVEAADGLQALDLAASSSPSLILLDVMMPDPNGFDVCRQLKEDRQTSEVPVVFVSAWTDVESRSKGLRLGAADYLAKPLHLGRLSQRVRLIMQQHALRGLIAAAPH